MKSTYKNINQNIRFKSLHNSGRFANSSNTYQHIMHQRFNPVRAWGDSGVTNGSRISKNKPPAPFISSQ